MLEIALPDCVKLGHRRGVTVRLVSHGNAGMRAFAAHSDPLAELSNWVALIIGTHLPFWPLYVLWSAGGQACPSSLLTAAMAPIFLAVPLISRKSSFLGRVATPVFGMINTVFTIWVLGVTSGTEVFLVPCAALAMLLFRRTERWITVTLTGLPLLLWLLMQQYPVPSLHRYDGETAHQLVILNVCSIGVLILLFGWLQTAVYSKMETESRPSA